MFAFNLLTCQGDDAAWNVSKPERHSVISIPLLFLSAALGSSGSSNVNTP